MDINTQMVDLVQQYLGTRIASHEVHAGNIANLDTPQYQAGVPVFRATMRKAMGGTAANEATSPWQLEMRVKKNTQGSRVDGNTVELEREMSAIAQNSMEYQAAVRILTKEFGLARYAIMSTSR